MCYNSFIMVRLINDYNLGLITDGIYSWMKLQEKVTYMVDYNNPKITPCVYVMWHGNQFCVHGLPDKNNVNILISTSKDGQIVSDICHRMGFQTCRGSSMRRGAVSGTLKLINKLKNGENVAIMVDGPRGPLYSVKPGAIAIAREAKVPIVPMNWYSKDFTFVKFNTWDKMTCPFGPARVLNTFGEPIYVEGKTDEEAAEEIKTALLKLDELSPERFEKAKKMKLWEKRQ